MAQPSPATKRVELTYFEGINALVGPNLAKKNELVHAENARSTTIGVIEKRGGTTLVGSGVTATANYGLFYFPSTLASSKYLYRISTVSGTTRMYHLNSSDVWTALTGEGTNLTAGVFKGVIADGKLLLVNYNDQNRYIDTDGTTVVDSTSASGDFYNSPNANCVAFYKNQIYLADYLVGSTRFKTSILRSSLPLGIVSLVNGDPDSPYTTVALTDLKYVYATAGANTYDVYRGNSQVGTYTVTAVNADNVQGTMSFAGSYTTILSADEFWIADTYNAKKRFRWVANGSGTGSPVKEYDTMRLSGGDESAITMLAPIGNVLMIANNSNLSIWNNSVLQSFDLGIGCVSRRGYTKTLGGLYFLHYNGIYVTDGNTPKLISSKVERYIYGATQAGKEACIAGCKGRSVFFWIGSVTLTRSDGSTEKTMNNVVLEYNITQEDWYVHTGITANYFETFVDSSSTDKLVYASADSGYPILEFLSTAETDNGTEISWRADTQVITLGSQFEKFGYPLEVILDVARGSGVQVFVSLDDGPFYQIEGEAVKGCTILKITAPRVNGTSPVRCRQIQLSFRHVQKQIVALVSAALTFNPTAEEENRREPMDPKL